MARWWLCLSFRAHHEQNPAVPCLGWVPARGGGTWMEMARGAALHAQQHWVGKKGSFEQRT